MGQQVIASRRRAREGYITELKTSYHFELFLVLFLATELLKVLVHLLGFE